MRTLLAALGDPQLAYPAIHVVGTNGKSTATLTIEALLRPKASPSARRSRRTSARWAERIRSTARPRTSRRRSRGSGPRPRRRRRRSSRRSARRRSPSSRRARSTPRSSRPASAAGSTRRTSSARTSSCSRTSGSSTRTCSATRARRSRPRSSRSCRREPFAVLPDEEFAHLAGPNVLVGGAREAAAAFLGRPVEREVEVVAAGQARAARRRGLGRRAQRRRRRVARRPARPLRLHDRRLDPARQGRRRDAAPTLAAPAAPRRDAVLESPRPRRPKSSHASPSRHFARSRPCPIPPRRSPARANMARCS